MSKDEKPSLTPEILQEYMDSIGVSAAYNEVSKQIEIEGMTDESSEHLNANISAILYSELQDDYRHCSIQTISAYLEIISSRNRFNPVLMLLDHYKWDKKDRLPELFNALNLSETDQLSRILVTKWMKQCVALLYNNVKSPFGADGVLVLVGAQGIGKTTFFRQLSMMPEFFKEGVTIDFRDKDTYIRALGCWIAELGEIESTFKSDNEKLKAFITQSVDEYRKPYGRGDIRSARKTSLCGTCNSKDFLTDPNGNRRFYTVEVSDIDLYALKKIDMVQLWKQIHETAFTEPQAFRLTEEEQKLLAQRNSLYEKKLKAQAEIEDILGETDTEEYTISMEYMTVSNFKKLNPILSRYSVQQIGVALDKLQVDMITKRVNGKLQRLRKLPKRTSKSKSMPLL